MKNWPIIFYTIYFLNIPVNDFWLPENLIFYKRLVDHVDKILYRSTRQDHDLTKSTLENI